MPTTERYIDMTPTWAALLPAMLAVLDNPDESFDVMNAKMNIRHELARMAKAADLYNKQAHDNARLDDGTDNIYIAHDTGAFLGHVTADGGNTTLCGLVRATFPDNIGSDGETWVDDKPWYSDHDRPDMRPCPECHPDNG